MNLLVRYQPVGEDWYEFELEEGLKITKSRNKAASCSVALPRTFATENASGYGGLQVLLNDKYLFDGTSQSKDFGKTKINLTGYDFLWDLSKERRMFEQGSTSLTPTEAFEQAFDNDGSFDTYFNPIWGETYGAPWLAGYDAKRFVVPADTAASYGNPFWDCYDKSGIDFMKQLADVSYKGNKYRYFYWYENIKGNKYLFFEPDGWGKTWKNMDYTIDQKLKTKFSVIWNNVVVWGKKRSGFFPVDQDYWTEKNLDGWIKNEVNGTTTLSTDPLSTFGLASFKINTVGIAVFLAEGGAYRTFSNAGNEFASFNTFTGLHFYYYVDNQANVNYYVYLVDSGDNITFYECTEAAGDWHEVTITGKTVADGWTSVHVDFDWNEVSKIYVIQLHAATEITRNYWVDNLYITFAPFRSENISNATGYDSDSADEYGKRTSPPINWPNLDTIDKCNNVSSALVNYYKDPQYNYGVKFNNFISFRLNENINLVKFQEDLTLPITKITWEFKQLGEIETTVDLGSPRMTLGDTLSKYSRDIIKPSKDRGLTYYVY